MSTAAAPVRTGAVLADLLPASRARDIALVVGGAALTGISAQLAVDVPGSTVPVSGQTFAALLVGTSLGARRGFLSLGLYLVAGMAGVPWFAQGTSGYAIPSLGYVSACCSPRPSSAPSPGAAPTAPCCAWPARWRSAR